MSSQEVRGMISEDLVKTDLIFPAKNISENSSGHQVFIPKENGNPGDIDAAFQVLVLWPANPYTNPYLCLFFEDRVPFNSGWFDADTAKFMQESLWTTESTD